MTAAARTGPPPNESPPPGEGGPGNVDCLAAIGSKISPIARPAQAARNPRALLRTRLDDARWLAHEAAGAAKLYAGTVMTFAELGDDEALDLAIGRLREAAVIAIDARKKIRELRSGVPA